MHDNDFRVQLKEVVNHFNIDIHKGLLGRCLQCNEKLADIDKCAAKGLVPVPVHVYDTNERFSINLKSTF